MYEYGIKIKISHVLPLLFTEKTMLDLLKGSFFPISLVSILTGVWVIIRILGNSCVLQ